MLMGEVTIRLRHQEMAHTPGHSADTDIVVAAAQAFVKTPSPAAARPRTHPSHSPASAVGDCRRGRRFEHILKTCGVGKSRAVETFCCWCVFCWPWRCGCWCPCLLVGEPSSLKGPAENIFHPTPRPCWPEQPSTRRLPAPVADHPHWGSTCQTARGDRVVGNLCVCWGSITRWRGCGFAGRGPGGWPWVGGNKPILIPFRW